MKFSTKNVIDIFLEYDRSIRKTKKHNLVFKLTISSLKSRFLLITLTNSHSMICISGI